MNKLLKINQIFANNVFSLRCKFSVDLHNYNLMVCSDIVMKISIGLVGKTVLYEQIIDVKTVFHELNRD